MLKIPTPIVLLVVLTITTSVIAYWSDNLGKKLGKKRISLFGLRPRQTATAISIVSSVAIMLVTLAIITIFSSPVRVALLHADEILARNKALGELNGKLTAMSDRLRLSVKQNQTAARQADRRAQTAVKKADKITSDANARMQDAKRQVASVESQLGSARLALTSAQRGESSARAAARGIEIRLNDAQARLSAAQVQLGGVNGQLRQAHGQLASLRLNMERMRASNKKSFAEYARAVMQYEKIHVQVEELNRQRTGLVANIQALSEKNVQLTNMINALDASAEAAKRVVFGTVVVDLNQTFGEVLVPPHAESTQVHATLSRLLEKGAQVVTTLGGKEFVNPDTGIKRALHLATLPGSNGDTFNEPQILDNFVNYLSTFVVPVSVRLVSFRRYAQGETEFYARLVAVPVRPVYARGAIIDQATIDGNQSDAKVFDQLINLAEKAGATARDKGVNPLISDANSHFFAGDTNERVFEAMRTLESEGGPRQVRLIAAEDVFTIDNPTVRFVVTAAPESK